MESKGNFSIREMRICDNALCVAKGNFGSKENRIEN